MAKSVKFKHPVYLSEKEICDEVESNFDVFFNYMGDSKLYREVSLGACRADFIEFTSGYINVIEVKITANIDAVRQVVFYKRVAEEHLRQNFSDLNLSLKQFCCAILARNIDQEIIDLCEDMQIALYRLKFDESKNLVGADPINEFFPAITESQEFIKIMQLELGANNG